MTATADPAEARQRLIGIGLIVLSAMALGCVDGFSKLLIATASAPQIVWARYALAFPFLLVFSARTLPTLFVTRNLRLQIVRGLTPLVVGFGMVVAVRFLPLAEATVVLFFAPLLVVALSGPLLGEHVHRSNWVAVGIGFLAVLVVARPGLDALSQYVVFPLVAAVFFALLQLITRRLASRGERPLTTFAWTLVTGGLATTPFAIAFWQPLDLHGWLLMFALGTCFGIGQLAIIAGLARAPASLAAPLSYVQIISAVIFGFVVFHEMPDVWTILGIAMIIGAGLFVVGSRRAA